MEREAGVVEKTGEGSRSMGKEKLKWEEVVTGREANVKNQGKKGRIYDA